MSRLVLYQAKKVRIKHGMVYAPAAMDRIATPRPWADGGLR
jgi:hypothetical protein